MSGEMSHWGSLSSSFSLDCFLNVCFALKPGLAGVDEVGMDVVGLGAVSLAHPRIIFFPFDFFRVFMRVNNADNLHIHVCENGGAEPVGRGSFRSAFSVSFPRGREGEVFPFPGVCCPSSGAHRWGWRINFGCALG